MVPAERFPLTNDALANLVGADGYYRVPASLTDYWELLADARYRIDYADHHIIATMSYQSDTHSRITSRVAYLLFGIFPDETQFIIYNSNRPVFIESYGGIVADVFHADGMVVGLPRQPYEYRKGMSAETNPVLLVEVLAPSTRAYDLGTKLPVYKQIPSLQTILFIEQDKPDVTVMERQAPNQWIETNYTQLVDAFQLNGSSMTLEQIYRGAEISL